MQDFGIIQLLTQEVFHVEQLCAGEVGKQHAERDREQEQRLILFADCKVDQHADDDIHQQRFACQYRIFDKVVYSGRLREVDQDFKHRLTNFPAYFSVTRMSPLWTVAPVVTLTDATTPSAGAGMSFSIFIASSTQTASPDLTV